MSETAYVCWEFEGPLWSAVMPHSAHSSSSTNFSAVIKLYFMAAAFPKLNIWATFNAKYQMRREILWTALDEETENVNSILNTENSFHTKNYSCYRSTVLILIKWRNYLVFVLTQSFQEGKCFSSQLAFLAQLISIPIFSLSTGELFSVFLKVHFGLLLVVSHYSCPKDHSD